MMATTTHPVYRGRKRNIRISPRKLRLAANLIRKQNVQRATELLQYSVTKSSKILGAVLANAISNAEQQNSDIDNLTVAAVLINKGMVLKRRKASGRGHTRAIDHRYSHIDIHLVERTVGRPAAKPATTAESAEPTEPTEAAKLPENPSTQQGS